MSYKYDALVFNGRFEPFHNGHKAIVDRALELSKEVIVIVGSSFAARDNRNPFTFIERKAMIKAVFPDARVKVVPVSDYPYDDNKWVASIQSLVYSTMSFSPDPLRIALIGHSKDHTSYYLKIFPNWDSVEVPNVDGIDATSIREYMYGRLKMPYYNEPNIFHTSLPFEVVEVIDGLLKDADTLESLRLLSDEHVANEDYKKPFKKLDRTDLIDWIDRYKSGTNMLDILEQFDKEFRPKYLPTYVTVDTVTIQSGHVLLVRRKHSPGKGLWAIPGGFIEQNETVQNGAIRELKEETKIKVPKAVLNGSISKSKVFDAPNRSSRGRTITHAFLVDLGFDKTLPKITAADDAEAVKWVPFNELQQDMFFEDHYFIIDYFLNVAK